MSNEIDKLVHRVLTISEPDDRWYRGAADKLANQILALQRRIDEAPTYWGLKDAQRVLPDFFENEERARAMALPSDKLVRVKILELPDKETELKKEYQAEGSAFDRQYFGEWTGDKETE